MWTDLPVKYILRPKNETSVRLRLFMSLVLILSCLCLWIILQFLDYTLLSCILDQGSDNLRTLYSKVLFIPFSMNIYTLGSVTLGAGFGTLRLGCPLSPPAPPTSAWYQAESRVSGVDAGTSETSRGVWTDLLGDPLSEN